MSLILEALKKSESRRRLGEAPDIGTPFTVKPRRRNPWPLIVVVLAIAGGVGWWYAGTLSAPKDADTVWPLEGQYQRRSYLGLPCFDSSGRVIGHIACADDKPMRDELPHHAILKIFSMRAAIEMERAALERSRATLAQQVG